MQGISQLIGSSYIQVSCLLRGNLDNNKLGRRSRGIEPAPFWLLPNDRPTANSELLLPAHNQTLTVATIRFGGMGRGGVCEGFL